MKQINCIFIFFQTLDGQMGLIKDLQERTPKPKFKFESTQTAEISLKPIIKPPDSREQTPRPNPPPSITPDLPKDFIQQNTHVYAVWFDRDCLVYEVC